MHSNERTPKLLPWLARKARISDDQALALWQRARAETAAADTMSPARAHSLAMDRLFELVAAESLIRRGPLYRLDMGFRTRSHLYNVALNLWDTWQKALEPTTHSRLKAKSRHAG